MGHLSSVPWPKPVGWAEVENAQEKSLDDLEIIKYNIDLDHFLRIDLLQ